MLKLRALLVLAAAASVGAGCARYSDSAGGDVAVSQTDAAKTVVLHVDNTNISPMELRAVVNGTLLLRRLGGRQRQHRHSCSIQRSFQPDSCISRQSRPMAAAAPSSDRSAPAKATESSFRFVQHWI